MGKDKPVPDDDIDKVVVRLKPLFGLSPGRWLAALGGLVLLSLLFLLLLLPGLSRPGTIFRFTSSPSGAAVFVDGGYAGTTPCELFLPKGDHGLVVSRPGFLELDVSRNVPGRLFGSLFFPLRDSVEARLRLLDGEKIWRDAVAEFSAWNLAGEPSSVWQAPAVLESSSYARFSDPDAPKPSWEERRDFFLASARTVSGAPAARELIRAGTIVFGSGDPASPEAAEGWRTIFVEAPALAGILLDLAPAEAASLPGVSGAPPLQVAENHGTPARLPPASVRSVRFLPVADPGSAPFFLAETETTVEQYSAFLREHPRWAPENLGRLLEEALVSEDYLRGFDTASPEDPVHGVSWYAAVAYAEWLDRSAPAGYKVRLPTEFQWAAAARAGGGTGSQIWSDGARASSESAAGRGRDAAGLADMQGNLWEWCRDSFAVHPEIGADAALRFPGSERSVRGGCWANARGAVTDDTRASFPPDWCSPFLGFRAALVPDIPR